MPTWSLAAGKSFRWMEKCARHWEWSGENKYSKKVRSSLDCFLFLIFSLDFFLLFSFFHVFSSCLLHQISVYMSPVFEWWFNNIIFITLVMAFNNSSYLVQREMMGVILELVMTAVILSWNYRVITCSYGLFGTGD